MIELNYSFSFTKLLNDLIYLRMQESGFMISRILTLILHMHPRKSPPCHLKKIRDFFLTHHTRFPRQDAVGDLILIGNQAISQVSFDQWQKENR